MLKHIQFYNLAYNQQHNFKFREYPDLFNIFADLFGCVLKRGLDDE